MKIREIRAAGLKGATPQGGWSSELVQEDCIHTLVVVLTDEDVTGVGSVFTNSDLVHAALAVLEPLLGDLAMPLRTLILSGIMVPLVVYLALPFATSRFRRWLAAERLTSPVVSRSRYRLSNRSERTLVS